MCLMKGMDRVSFDTDPAGRLCKQKRQNHQVCDNTDLAVEINRRVLQGNPVRLRRYDLALNDQSTELLRLQVRMLKSRGHETMLYGCVTWSPAVPHLAILRTAHHRLLFRCIGLKRKRRDGYHMLSYAGALAKRDNGAKTKDTFRGVRGSYG